MQVRSIAPLGHFRWQGAQILLSEALAGERVGLQQISQTPGRGLQGPRWLAC
jgi:hypothetical protein